MIRLGNSMKMIKEPFPNRVTVELTNDCNLACSFCNHQKIKMDIGYMSTSLYYKIVDEMAEHLPIKMVPFFRGEPLLHPDIVENLKYAKEKGIGPIQLTSNALLLDEEKQEGLIDAGVDYISFSLDTLDNEIYKCSRVGGDLETSNKNVEAFCLKCKEKKSKGIRVPTIQVSTINVQQYREGQKEFVDKWIKLADVVRIYEEHDEKGRLVDPNIQEKLGIFDKRMPCRKIFTDMIIYWDGRVALCNYDWDETVDYGNASLMSLQDIWNSRQYEDIRNKHLTGNICDGICNECHHWKIDYTEKGYIGTSYIA